MEDGADDARTGHPIAPKIAITVVGFLCITAATLLSGEFPERVLAGRLRGARAGGVPWEELVRVEVGEVLISGPKSRIKRRGGVIGRASARSLCGRWRIWRHAGRCGGGAQPSRRGWIWVLLLLLLWLLLLLLLVCLLALLALLLLLLLRAVRSEVMLVHGGLLLWGCELSAIAEVGSSVLVVVCAKGCRCHSN